MTLPAAGSSSRFSFMSPNRRSRFGENVMRVTTSFAVPAVFKVHLMPKMFLIWLNPRILWPVKVSLNATILVCDRV